MPELITTYLPYLLLSLGAIFGTFILELVDPFIFAFLQHPEHPTAQAFRELWQTKQLKYIFNFWKHRRLEGERYLLHSLIFQPLLLVVTYFAVLTAGNRMVVGMLVAATILMVTRQLRDYGKWKQLGPWAWPIRGGLTPQTTKIYLTIVTLLSFGLLFFVL